MKVYQKVRAYLDENGIKQNVIARKSNISVTTFSAIMTGRRKMYADDLYAICYALKVKPEEFIESESV
jgi:transcriptional regulator with XRE-family HTH domain